MRAQFSRFIDQAADFASQSLASTAFLPEYQQPRTPAASFFRHLFAYAIFIFLGMCLGFMTVFLQIFAQLLILPIVLMIGLVIWTLPAAKTIPRTRSLIVLFFAFNIALGMWPNYVALKLPGFPWISAQRLIAGPLAVLLLIVLSRWRSVRDEVVKALRNEAIISRFAVGFFIVQLLSVITASNIFFSIFRYMDASFTWTAILFVAIITFRNDQNVSRWVKSVVIIGAIQAVLSIAEQHNKSVLFSWVLIRLPAILQADPETTMSVINTTIDPISGKYRTKGIYTTALSLGEYMSLAAPFLLYMISQTRMFSKTIVSALLFVLVTVGILANGSRLGLIALVLGSICFGFLWAIDFWRSKRSSLLAACLVIAMPAGAATIGAGTLIFPRVNAFFFGTGIQTLSTEARKDQFALLPAALAKRPVTGYGPGNGGVALGYYQPGGLLTVDTYIITALLDYGILGFIGFFGMMIAAFAAAVKQSLDRTNPYRFVMMAASSALLSFFVIRTVLSEEANNAFLFMLVGLVLALSLAHKHRQTRDA